jgi:tRNA(Ile)-lysidine synthase
MQFLRKMAQVHNCQWIAFGHQMNDVLETQLQRLARGSGVVGMAAPRPVHVFEGYADHLRPLLGLKAHEIRSMLQAADICWREDSSNLDDSIQRNGLRHQIVPKMQLIMDRDLLLGAAKSRERMQEDAEALDGWAANVYADIAINRWCLNLLGLRSMPVAIIRRCLFIWMREHFDLKKLRSSVMEPIIAAIVSKKVSTRYQLGIIFYRLKAIFYV